MREKQGKEAHINISAGDRGPYEKAGKEKVEHKGS